MKLKKIASLALAGVMAVSMLAGCANKPGNNDDNQGEVVETSNAAAVEAMNNGQADTNAAKVDFTDGSDLVAALKAVAQTQGIGSVAGSKFDADSLLEEIVKNTGVGGTYGGATATVTLTNKRLDQVAAGTDAETALYLFRYDADAVAQNEGIALMQAAKTMNDTYIKNLDATTKDTSSKQGDTYYDYTYTGKTGLLTVKAADNHIYYLVICSITRTGTKGTV